MHHRVDDGLYVLMYLYVYAKILKKFVKGKK